MKIGIDISQIAYQGTGVARYTGNLIESILHYDTDNEYIFFFSSLRQKLDPILAQKIRQKHTLKIFPFPPTLLDIIWNKIHTYPINKLIGNCDIFVSSDWTQPPISSPTTKITVVHDLVYLRYPETLHPKIIAVQKRRMEWVKKECDLIIADSQSTKQDLIDLLDIDPSRIRVVYPAVQISQPNDSAIKSVLAKYKIQNHPKDDRPLGDTKYILSVGKLEPRKNIPRLISAFQKANLKDTQLVIVGPNGWDTTPQNTNYKIPDTVKFLGYVPDADLYPLYAGALFFIYPSLYEGFGYPIVEAMALGCPVATSNTSSMKEIATGAGLLFDPQSKDEIVRALTQLSQDEKLKKELVQKGKKRAENFNKRFFAKQFLGTINIV